MKRIVSPTSEISFMNSNKEKTIVFDFDGVFTDSFSTTLEALQTLHTKFQLPEVTADDLRNLFCENFWEKHREYGLDEETEKVFKSELLVIVESKQPEIHFFPGMQEVIKNLSDKVQNMIIISSNKTSAIEDKLATIHLEKNFSKILGADKPGNKKEKMGELLREAGDKGTIFFVTDTLGDVKETKEFPVTVVATTWGYHPEEVLVKGEPDYIARTPQDLASILT